MSTKYIVIPSLAIGGAEKRFFDLFCALFDADNTYYLVLPQALHEQLSAQIELPKQYASNIIVIGRPGGSLVAFCIKYWAWLNKNVKGEAIFHYPINCLFPFHFFRKHSVSVSLTHCYAAPTFFTMSRSLFRQRLTMLFVNKVDVLNPMILQTLKKKLWFSKKKLSQTPAGTFVNPLFYSYGAKKPKVVILTRLIEGKGIIEFLTILPEIWAGLETVVPKDFCFYICGNGPLSESVGQTVSRLSNQGIPIEYLGFVSPNDVLQDTSIVLSLQKVTNYPSRVVVESIFSGCHVLIRDSGDSRLFGQSDITLSYISDELNAKEIAAAIVLQINNFISNDNLPKDIRELGIEKALSGETVSYFKQLIS